MKKMTGERRPIAPISVHISTRATTMTIGFVIKVESIEKNIVIYITSTVI
jgi:hypothetical protein